MATAPAPTLTHDGKKPFTVKLSFSEKPELGYKTVRDSLIEVSCATESCGTVTGASRVTKGNDSEWKATVKPSQGYDITLTLPVRGCDETGAVCVGGRPLAGPASATIPGKPLTATLTGPAEHDGSESFTVRLTFSMEPDVSYKTVRDTMFTEKGGAISGAKRVKPPHDLEFDITVEPDGDGAVSLSLASPLPACGEAGAVCTAAGRKIEGTVSATIPGPVAISVADATVREGPGAVLAFVVTLDRARDAAVTVDYATVPGTGAGAATENSDYTGTSGTLTFAADETEQTVSVPVLADDHDEGSETLTLKLSNPVGARIADDEATGTIQNTGPIPQAWIARFGRTVGEQAVDAVEARFGARREPGLSGRIAGQGIGGFAGSAREDDTARADEREARHGLAAFSDWLGNADEDKAPGFGSRTLSGREMLTGSSFALTGGSEDRGFGAFWGRGAVTRFDGREGGLTLDGEVASAMLGADFSRNGVLAGLMISHSRGEGGYRSPSGGGEVSSTLTALFPYGRYAFTERVSVWGMAGYGEGTLALTPDGHAQMRPGMDLVMGALGVRGVLVDGGSEGMTLAVKSDVMAVRTATEAVPGLVASEADVTRVRLGLKGSRPIGLGGGAVLTRSLELGVRHDGGDAETGFGADIGAGLELSDPARGLSAEVRARGLLTHEAGGMRQRGVSGTLSWDPAPNSDRGSRSGCARRWADRPRAGRMRCSRGPRPMGSARKRTRGRSGAASRRGSATDSASSTTASR